MTTYPASAILPVKCTLHTVSNIKNIQYQFAHDLGNSKQNQHIDLDIKYNTA